MNDDMAMKSVYHECFSHRPFLQSSMKPVRVIIARCCEGCIRNERPRISNVRPDQAWAHWSPTKRRHSVCNGCIPFKHNGSFWENCLLQFRLEINCMCYFLSIYISLTRQYVMQRINAPISRERELHIVFLTCVSLSICRIHNQSDLDKIQREWPHISIKIMQIDWMHHVNMGVEIKSVATFGEGFSIHH